MTPLSLPFYSLGMLKGALPLSSRERLLPTSALMSLDCDSPVLDQLGFGVVFIWKTALSVASQFSL